ncbi:MAG: hypothetical protein WB615_09025 [Candidatus Tumulicola sp.]
MQSVRRNRGENEGQWRLPPSPMAAKLKGNAQARTQFVNIVAAPLLNKMIDCNMLPGGQ